MDVNENNIPASSNVNTAVDEEIFFDNDDETLIGAILQKDWDRTIQILNSRQHLVLHMSVKYIFTILWGGGQHKKQGKKGNDPTVPVQVILALFNAWPTAYKQRDEMGKTFLERKMEFQQWDYLEVVIKEFPAVIRKSSVGVGGRVGGGGGIGLMGTGKMRGVSPSIINSNVIKKAISCGASLDFVHKYWTNGPVPMLLYNIIHRNWEKVIEILDTSSSSKTLVKEEITTEEAFTVLWEDAPMNVIRHLLQIRVQMALERKKKRNIIIKLDVQSNKNHDTDSNDKHSKKTRRQQKPKFQNLIEWKIYNKEWKFVEMLFTEFPQLLNQQQQQQIISVADAVLLGMPLDILKRYWKNDVPILLYSLYHQDYDTSMELLQEEYSSSNTASSSNSASSSTAADKVTPANGSSWYGCCRYYASSAVTTKKKQHVTVQQQFVTAETFAVLWDHDVPFDIIRKVLEVWPGAYKRRGNFYFAGTKKSIVNDDDDDDIDYDYDENDNQDDEERDFDLIESKCYHRQWEFLKQLVTEFPHVVSSQHVYHLPKYNYFGATALSLSPTSSTATTSASRIPISTNIPLSLAVPIDLFEQMLRLQPKVALESYHPLFSFELIEQNQYQYFQAIIQQCPEAITVQHPDTGLTPLLYLLEIQQQQQRQRNVNATASTSTTTTPPANTIVAWIDTILQASNQKSISDMKFLDTAAKDVNFDGKHPLHLAYQYNLSRDVITLIHDAYPDAINVRDNFGRLPTELFKIGIFNDGTLNEEELGATTGAPCGKGSQRRHDLVFTSWNEVSIVHSTTANTTKADIANSSSTSPVTNDFNDVNNKKHYPDDAVVVCRGDVLMRDLSLGQQPRTNTNDEDVTDSITTTGTTSSIGFFYIQQVRTRHQIFETLINEFSKLVGVDDKDVIQKSVTVQALIANQLSRSMSTSTSTIKHDKQPHNNNGDGEGDDDGKKIVIDFRQFPHPGYWYQQEILKLVMRVYHEGESTLAFYGSSIRKDAEQCLQYIEDSINDNGTNSSLNRPSEPRTSAFEELIGWLTEGLDKDLYSVQGPVLKPLQSLFNKIFIRRGQTSVQIIGDMVRATLLIDDRETLKRLVTLIETTFPNIAEESFRHPDKCKDGVVGFLRYVHENLKFLPGSTDVLPYRFKMNSSQQKKKKRSNFEPLWYNFNFFHQIPEYHRVGFSEMFVAFELQIGLNDEINSHRKSHVAYERERILANQPLLKNYLDVVASQTTADGGSTGSSSLSTNFSNCSKEDIKLIDNVLMGKIASEVIVPSSPTSPTSNSNNMLVFEHGPFSVQGSGDVNVTDADAVPTRLCINNRSLNWHAAKEKHGAWKRPFACTMAGPFHLGSTSDDDNDGNDFDNNSRNVKTQTKRYFVDSLIFDEMEGSSCTVGLYAHVGPNYLIQVASCGIERNTTPNDKSSSKKVTKTIVPVVVPGCNYTFLERACFLPIGTTAVEIIVNGSSWGNIRYMKMSLVIKEYDILL